MTRRRTNVEIITDFMDFCPTGAMGQMFIVDALTKYATRIIDNKDEVLEQMKDGFIDGHAWVATAKALKAHLDEAYDPPRSDDNLETFSRGHVAIDADGITHN